MPSGSTPTTPTAHCNLGTLLARQGQLDLARAQFVAAVRLDPGNSLARTNLGVTLLRQGRLEEALRECARAQRLDPDNADAQHPRSDFVPARAV